MLLSRDTCVLSPLPPLTPRQVRVAFLETASTARESVDKQHKAKRDAAFRRSRTGLEYGGWRLLLPRRHTQIRLLVRPRVVLDLALVTNASSRSLNRSSPRPASPPSASSNANKSRPGDASPTQSRNSAGERSAPPFKSYINFLSNTNDDWKADTDEMMGYDDDDGDEFGLPSLSNTKRRTRRIQGHGQGDSMSLTPTPVGTADLRRYSNSADIAVERPTPSYPMPKKSEGKILRPQYKEILRGQYRHDRLKSLSTMKLTRALLRPRQRSTSHYIPIYPRQCHLQGV
jgi:hypothetical protein